MNRETVSRYKYFPSQIPILVPLPYSISVRTCGKPNIQNIMNNVTAKPGQSAMFKCQVDMSCIVAYIEWYHEMDNGTEKLIKVRNYARLTHWTSVTYRSVRSLRIFRLPPLPGTPTFTSSSRSTLRTRACTRASPATCSARPRPPRTSRSTLRLRCTSEPLPAR